MSPFFIMLMAVTTLFEGLRAYGEYTKGTRDRFLGVDQPVWPLTAVNAILLFIVLLGMVWMNIRK